MTPELPLTPIEIGSLTVYPYGICLAAAVLICAIFAAVRVQKLADGPRRLTWFLVLALPIGLLLSRLGWCLCTFEQTVQYIEEDGILYLFQFNRGGLLIYGALAGSFLALLLSSRITRGNAAELADALAAPAMLMIFFRKLSDLVTGEGYGWPVNEWFAGEGMSLITLEDPSFFCRFPIALPDMYDGWRWAVCVFEALLALVLLFVLDRKRPLRQGGKAVLFLILYASTQLLCESMRQDAVLRWGFVRVNQILGAILLLGLMIYGLTRLDQSTRKKVLLPGLLLLIGGFLVVTAMEFALEGKISLIESMPMDVCYLIMAGGVALTIIGSLKVWKPVFRSRK